MSPFWRVILGIIVMLLGIVMVFKSETLLEWFGENDWAEEKLGYGQSRFFYKLLGLGTAFLGILIITNIISDILGGLAGLFIR